MQARPDQLPDHHFLLVAPNLSADWLFDAARDYWRRFRPVVVSSYALVRLVPPERTVIVTALARRDMAADLGVELAQFRPDAYFDPLVFETLEQAHAALMQRVDLAQPFGVQLVIPTETPDPNAPAIPTPRLAPSRPPAGFITQGAPATNTPEPSLTPSPSPTPSTTSTSPASPTPAPDDADDSPDSIPLSPTPGSIFGG